MRHSYATAGRDAKIDWKASQRIGAAVIASGLWLAIRRSPWRLNTKPEPRYDGDSKLGPWFELLDDWGVLEFLWKDQHKGAPPLGEPMGTWLIASWR